MVAEVARVSSQVMFDTHLYTFGGKVFRQKEGDPIGLRGTCAIPRLIMYNWDRGWMRTMEFNSITISGYWRYMDDGRILLPPFKMGWKRKEMDDRG